MLILYKTENHCRKKDFFKEEKLYCAYLNQLFFTYEGYTDGNGEMLKCHIYFNKLKIDAEDCRLPCGNFNCKTCIEGWFYIRTENSG